MNRNIKVINSETMINLVLVFRVLRLIGGFRILMCVTAVLNRNETKIGIYSGFMTNVFRD